LEQLEDRRLLSGDLAGAMSQLNATLRTELASLSSLPVAGSLFSDASFVSGLVNSLTSQLTASFQTTASSGGGGSDQQDVRDIYATGHPIHPPGQGKSEPLSLPLGNLITLTNPQNVNVWVDMYYNDEYLYDPDTSGVTMVDRSLSRDTSTLLVDDPAVGPGGATVAAPNATFALIVSITLPPGFSQQGKLSGTFPIVLSDHAPLATRTLEMTSTNFGTYTGDSPPNPVSWLDGVAGIDMNMGADSGTSIPFATLKVGAEVLATYTFTHQQVYPNPPPANQLGSLPQVEFRNVTVDLGSLIGVAGDVLSDIQSVTDSQAMSDTLAFWNLTIPIINVSVHDYAAAAGLIPAPVNDVINIINGINQFHIAGQGNNGVVVAGTFDVSDPRQATFTITDAQSGDSVAIGNAVNQVIQTAPSYPTGYGLHVPVLEDPVHVLFPILIGQNMPLFTFKTPPIDVALNFNGLLSLIHIGNLLGIPGISLNGEIDAHLQVDVGYDMAGFQKYNQDQLQNDPQHGLYINNSDTSVVVNGDLVLSAGGILRVEGGIYANATASAGGQPDPVDPNKRRPDGDLSNPFAVIHGTGKVWLGASIIAGFHTFLGDVTLFSITLAYDELLNFDSNVQNNIYQPNPTEPNVIRIHKSNTDETIRVHQVSLPDAGGDPIDQAYDSAIEVVYPDHKEDYLTAHYVKQGNNFVATNDLGHYNLVATDGNYGGGKQTIIVDPLIGDGEGTPVNAVLIGGSDDDTLEYHAAGHAVIVGGAGNNTLRSDATKGMGTGSVLYGGFIQPDVPLASPFTIPSWEQTLLGQVNEPPGPTVNSVEDVMVGSDGPDTLVGGDGSNVFDEASRGVSIYGEGVSNVFDLHEADGSANSQGYVRGVTGLDTVVFERPAGTPANPDVLNLAFSNPLGGPLITATGTDTSLGIVGVNNITVQANGGIVNVGDLTPFTNFKVIVQGHTSPSSSRAVFAAPLAGTSTVHLSANVTDQGLLFSNGSGGAPVAELLDLTPTDNVRVQMNGGQTNIDDLSGLSLGSVIIDGSGRPAGSNAVNSTTMTMDPNTINMVPDTIDPTIFHVTASGHPDVQLVGLAPQDVVTTNVSAPAGEQIYIDASQMLGQLHVNALGDATHVNTITFAKAGPQAAVIIDGGTTTTSVTVGNSRLSDIEHSASVYNAMLKIDDSAAASPDIGSLAPTYFQWTIPALGITPTLNVSGLQGDLTILAGAGDRYDIEGTPPGINHLVLNNTFDSQDAIYATAATAPVIANGDFNIYLGWRLNLDGSIVQLNHLNGLATSVTLNFSGTATNDVVLDGDADPAGANYTIDGVGNLHVLNQTVGLNLTINGYRDQDQLEVHLPGGSVHAILTQTGRGTISIDGQARASGTNPSAANNITVDTRAGTDTLDPTGPNNSVLHVFDTLFVKGALQQDNLTLNVPTVSATANSFTADASQLLGTLQINVADPLAGVLSPFGLTTIILSVVNPLLAVFIVGTNPFPGSSAYQVAQTTLDFGTGQLARIQGNVTVSKAVLNIDDSAAAQSSNLQLTDTTFNNWVIPGTSMAPSLSYSNLYSTLTVAAGAGDKFELNRTPATINSIVLNNATASQDAVYSTQWTVPITANGNWSMYFGWNLHTDGIVERIKQLVGLAIPVTLNFSGAPTGFVYLDGDSDPPGAQYTIDGNGNLHVLNQTVGLNVTINGFRAQDQVYIYMAGGAVAADLTQTGPGTFYVDGKSRLSGNHPSAPNSISAQVRAGNTSLNPVATNDSVLQAFNTFYVLGSMPQDSLNITAPTHFKVASTLQGNPRSDFGMFPAPGDYIVANQPPCYYTILSLPVTPTTDHGDPPILVQNTPTSNVDYVDTTLQYQWVGGSHPGLPDTITVGVREFPNNPNPAAIDNNVNFDASQLRGVLSFQVTQPNYALAEQLVQAFGNLLAGPVTTFGQTSVNLSKVNPQLSVTVNGTTPISNNDLFTLGAYSNAVTAKILHFAGTQMTVGAGVLANVQGNVTVHNVWLKEVDDRSGTLPANITLTSGTMTGWATAGGGASPTLSFDTLQGDVTLTGSPADQFAIEGTPSTAPKVTVRNLATTGPAPGVYVMSKSVMPLYVSGNLTLNVGRRLNADGSVTAVGQVDNVYNWLARYQQTGGSLTGYTGTPSVFQDLQLISASPSANVLPGIPLYNYIPDLYSGIQLPLPVFFDYAGPGQGTLVMDTSNDVFSLASGQGHLGSITYDPFFNYDGVTANTSYPGHADLRFMQGDLVYGSNTEVFDYGAQQVGSGTSLDKPGPAMLIDNPLATPFHFISGTNGPNTFQEVLIGATQGPITVQGGPGTRVEANPLFAAPTSGGLSLGVPYNGGGYTDLGLPGWSSGDPLGYSLLDTIHADVSVTGGALRVVGGIPLPAGVQPPAMPPDVHVAANEITGLAGAPIHFSNLVDTPSTAFLSRGGYLDFEVQQLPALSIELAQNPAVTTYVDDTPAGVTTNLSTILSSGDAALTTGPINVLKTTGSLVLGDLFGNMSFYWPTATGLPIGQSLFYSDGLSAQSVTIGAAAILPGDFDRDGVTSVADLSAMMGALSDLSKYQTTRGLSNANMSALGDLNGDGQVNNLDLEASLVRLANAGGSIAPAHYSTLGNIQGAILLAGDTHSSAAPLVTTIDGSADAARPAVAFKAQSYTTPPGGIIASTSTPQASAAVFFEEVNGLAPAPIYFGNYFGPFSGVRNLNVYGSDNSSYTVTAAPATMHLYAGAGSTVVDNSAPIDIVGAWTVQLMPGYYPAISLYTGPQVIVEEDPARRHPIDLIVNQDPVLTPNGTLHLDSAGGGLLDLSLIAGPYDYWQALFAGADCHLTVNFGPIVITDTGAAGTVINSAAQEVDVNGTTGPLTINSGASLVQLGQSGNMQAIAGEVDIASNDPAKPIENLQLRDTTDSLGRIIHFVTDADGNLQITGMAPGLVKLIGARFTPSLYAGTGGTTFRFDNNVFPQASTSVNLYRGSLADVLAGPDLTNTWQISNADYVVLNGNIIGQNIRNLQGGAGADTFNFTGSGQISGNLDGGAGIDTLTAPTFNWRSLVGGTVSNLEIVPMAMTNPGNQTEQAGSTITPIQLPIVGGLGSFMYSATGLPAGLSINGSTGQIIGAPFASAISNTPYSVHVAATDGFNSASADFQITVVANSGQPLLGDVDIDSHVTIADVSALMTALRDVRSYQTSHSLSASGMLAVADTDFDGHVTNLDTQALICRLASGGGSGASAGGSPVPAAADSNSATAIKLHLLAAFDSAGIESAVPILARAGSSIRFSRQATVRPDGASNKLVLAATDRFFESEPLPALPAGTGLIDPSAYDNLTDSSWDHALMHLTRVSTAFHFRGETTIGHWA
jgi:hypothetical protein